MDLQTGFLLVFFYTWHKMGHGEREERKKEGLGLEKKDGVPRVLNMGRRGSFSFKNWTVKMSSLLLQRFLPQHTCHPLTCEKPHCPTILETCTFPFLGSECVIWTLGEWVLQSKCHLWPKWTSSPWIGDFPKSQNSGGYMATVAVTWTQSPSENPVSPLRPYIIQFPITSLILSAYYSCPGSLCSGTLAYQVLSLLRNFTCSFCSFFLEWSSSNISINIFLTPSGSWNVFIMCGLLHIMLCRSFI